MKIPTHNFDLNTIKVSKNNTDRKQDFVWPNQSEVLEEIKLLGNGFVKCIKM